MKFWHAAPGGVRREGSLSGPTRWQGGRHPVRDAIRDVAVPGAVILVLAGALAAGSVWYPPAAMAAPAVVLAALVARWCPAQVEGLFLRLLVSVLIGYALLGRTFAGIGVPPLYVGELALAAGVLAAFGNGWHPRLTRSPSIYLLIAFMAWGAARTIPFVGVYGLNALRDAVLWGYGVFALLVAPPLLRRNLFTRAADLYSRWIPWIVLCAPTWVIISEGAGLTQTAFRSKPGDAAVHLGGAAAFLLAGAWVRRGDRGAGGRWFAKWAVWPALLIGLVAVGSLNRGGLVAALAAMLTVLTLLPFKAGGKLALAGATAMLLGALWLGSGISIHVRRDRSIDPEQILKNLESVRGSGGESMEGTRRWRILWWNAIIDYTVHGQYFWGGKGYGINLAYDDGIEPFPESTTRSPHNGNLTILARSGVPGLTLWALLQLSFAFTVLLGFMRARRSGDQTRAALLAWTLAYWLAFLINASFDVALEGPQVGIWFWCMIGYGLALVAGQGRGLPGRPRSWAPGASTPFERLQPAGAR